MALTSRLAPTPSGLLHLGNAWSFVLTWLAVKSVGGSLRLRIDDLDATRAQDEYLEDVFASLAWLGIECDAGPRDVAAFKRHDSQRLRLDAYGNAVEVLKAGGHLYACTCSRAQIRAFGEGTVYPGTCRERGLPLNTRDAALRFRMPDGPVVMQGWGGGPLMLDPARTMGDFVVVRRDGEPAYQLASVVDDVTHGVNLIVRGNDLLPSTAAQLALAQALGGEIARAFTAITFWHHPLVLDDLGDKLSKSRGADSLAALRARFETPTVVLQWFARALGFRDEAAARVRSLQDLLPGFDRARLPTTSLRLSDFGRFAEANAGP